MTIPRIADGRGNIVYQFLELSIIDFNSVGI